MNALGNKWLRLTLTAVALSMIPGFGDRTVAAHSVVTSSNPAANARIATRDIEIEVQFNGRIDAARSKLTLMLPDRTRRTQTIKEGTQPNLLAASVAVLAPGDYTLQWQELSADGHIARSDIPFKVVDR